MIGEYLLLFICRGVCNGAQADIDGEIVNLGSLTRVEQDLCDQEAEFFLSRVNYEEYWGKIKLVGYTMQLRPEHMQMISPTLGIDYEKDLLGNQPSDAKRLLQDEKFGYHDGLHEPSKMLLLGFMYCTYDKIE